jgi:hypothetical protein
MDTFHRSARTPPAARGHAGTSPAVKTPQVTALIHDFASSWIAVQAFSSMAAMTARMMAFIGVVHLNSISQYLEVKFYQD